MAWSSPFTAVTGNVIAASDHNTYIRDNLLYLYRPGDVRVYHNAAQSIANVTATDLAFNSEQWDSGGYHDTVTNNNRLTLGSGYWLVGANVEFASNATGQRRVQLWRNGTTDWGTFALTPINGDVTIMAICALIENTAGGDYVTAGVYQSSGGALNVNSVGNHSPYFWAVKVGN